MIHCPACNSEACRRSKRRSLADYAYSVVGMIPWRCSRCEVRFRARNLSLNDWRYAHCSVCGNLDLRRISPEYVSGPTGPIGRLLGLPSFRCDPCRNKFFSVRPLKQQAESETGEQQRVA